MRGILGWRTIATGMIETALLLLCGLAAFGIRLHTFPQTTPERVALLLKGLLIALTFQLFFFMCDIYDYRKANPRVNFLLRLGNAIMLASATLWAVYYLFPDLVIGRGVFLLNMSLNALCLFVWHTLIRIYFGVRPAHTHMLVLGTGRLARTLVREVLARPHLGYKVEGFIDDNPALIGVSVVNPKVIGLHEDLPKIVSERKVNKIVVELLERRGRLPTTALLEMKTRGIDIEDATTFYEQITGKIAIENLKPSWLIFNGGFDASRHTLVLKDICEVLISAALLIALSPLILLIMIAIKLDSPGPVFHKQERVGKDGEIFTIWKFRSMFRDAESATGPVWAEKNDPRVTRVGKWLRRTRLDEVPQLFSVFKGDMSLVGPRPERPEFVRSLAATIPYYPLRHSVKPGVTGWAQINNGYANSVENTIEKLQYDLFYIKNMSPQLDTFITLETIKTCLTLRGV
jgi:sugar transferase (PEP-CTERM system associated)